MEATLQKVRSAGGGQIGELVTTKYKDGRTTDIEGNIIEIQSWSKIL